MSIFCELTHVVQCGQIKGIFQGLGGNPCGLRKAQESCSQGLSNYFLERTGKIGYVIDVANQIDDVRSAKK